MGVNVCARNGQGLLDRKTERESLLMTACAVIQVGLVPKWAVDPRRRNEWTKRQLQIIFTYSSALIKAPFLDNLGKYSTIPYVSHRVTNISHITSFTLFFTIYYIFHCSRKLSFLNAQSKTAPPPHPLLCSAGAYITSNRRRVHLKTTELQSAPQHFT